MKNWLDKMERRFGRYAIRNLTMYLLAGYAIGYLLSFTMPQLLTYFTLVIRWKATGGHFVTMFTFSQEYYLQLLELLL